MFKKPVKVMASLGVALSLFATSNGMTAEASNHIGYVEVKVDSLNLRADDSFQSTIVRTLHKGEKYKVYRQSNGMYNLGGNQWTSANSRYVTYTSQSGQANTAVASAVSKGTVTVKAGSLNIRQSASFSAKIVGIANSGQRYTILEERNGLYRIGENRWITASSKYVTASSGATQVVANAQPVTTAPNQSVQNVIATGKQYMGMKYVWASANPKYGGFDCSGFIYYIFKNNGYNINRLNVEGYWNTVKRVSTPQVGDLVFFKDTYRKGPSHIGVYIGNGQFLNANSSDGVSIDNLNNRYWQKHFLGYGTFTR